MRSRIRGWSALIGAVASLATRPAWAGDEPDGALPPYTVAEASDEIPVREVPRSGRGMQVTGGLGLVGAATVAAGSVVLAVDGRSSDLWGPTMVLAISGAVGSSLLVWGGTLRQQHYRAWLAERPDEVPSQGTGLVGAGAFLLTAGAAGGLFGTVGWVLDASLGFNADGTTSPIWPTLFGLGLTGLTVGSTLTIIGMRRHREFQAWRRTVPVELVPSVTPLVLRGRDGRLSTGVQIGLLARF